MIIDLFALIVVAALAFLGWKSGFVRQVVHWLALIASAVLAPPLGLALVPHVGPLLARSFPDWVAPTMALLLAWLVLFCLFDLAAVLLHKLVHKAQQEGVVQAANQLAGGIIGGLKGLAIVVLIGTAIYLLRTPLGTAYPELKPAISHSYLIAAIATYNPLVERVKDWRRGYLRSQKGPVERAGAGTARPEAERSDR